jgi:hypothetical protein
MVIDPPLARRFIDAYMAFLGSLVSDADKQAASSAKWLVKGRSRCVVDRSLLDTYKSPSPQCHQATGRRDAERQRPDVLTSEFLLRC